MTENTLFTLIIVAKTAPVTPATNPATGTPYVLSIDGGVIAFRQFTGASIPANKAYYVQ